MKQLNQLEKETTEIMEEIKKLDNRTQAIQKNIAKMLEQKVNK